MKDKTIFEGIDKKLLERFKAYHEAHPKTWEEFKLNCMVIKRARKTYSHWAIISAIRWSHDINPSNEAFKVNNDYISLYARLMIYNFPEFKDFFSLRRMKSDNRQISDEEQYRSPECNKL